MDSFRFLERDGKIVVLLCPSLWQEAISRPVGSITELCAIAADLPARRLVVDFQGVELMTSPIIGWLVLLNKAARNYRLDLRFINVSPTVMEVFKITKVDRVLSLDDDESGEEPRSPVLKPSTSKSVVKSFQNAIAVLPALAGLLTYELFLNHRHDYAGHYAAGYGATFATLMLLGRLKPLEKIAQYGPLALLPLCALAILAGAIAEMTAFRIAKFDEIDFCNQSLGAVLACLVAVRYAGAERQSEKDLDVGLIVGIVFLSIGGCLAVA